MMNIKLTHIEGLDKMVSELNKCEASVRQKGIKAACDGAGKILKKALKAALSNTSPSQPGGAPGVVTGNLKNSVDYIHRKKYPGNEYTIVGHKQASFKDKEGAATGAHAHLLELGTVKMAARPYFKPTFLKNTNPMMDEMAAQLEKALYG